MIPSSTVGPAVQAQEAYRSQLAQGRADRQLASLARNLDETARIGTVVGADTSAAVSARQRLENTGPQPQASTRVSLSEAALSRLRAEQQAAAANATPAAGTQAATATTNPATVSALRANASPTATETTTAAGRNERVQFRSVDEAIAYGAMRAAEQARAAQAPESAGRSGSADSNLRTGQTNAADTRSNSRVSSDPVAYGTQRALEQYAQQAAARPRV